VQAPKWLAGPVAATRFPILFTGLNKGMAVLGILPRWSFVEVDDDVVRVRMSWAFRGTIPRSSVRSASRYLGRVYGWGAHGWRGEWLVNGSSSGIVEVAIDPPARARTLGYPVELRVLRVSVTEPEALIAALS
jgi:hypothetical protein